MTDEERELLIAIGDCWNKFCLLPRQHASDADDFVTHVHALQMIVMVRMARRSMPEFFKIENPG